MFVILRVTDVGHRRLKVILMIDPAATSSLRPKTLARRMSWLESAGAPCLELISRRFWMLVFRRDHHVNMVASRDTSMQAPLANLAVLSDGLFNDLAIRLIHPEGSLFHLRR